jgi:hypothetical protein
MAQLAKHLARSWSGPVVNSSLYQVREAHANSMCQGSHTSTLAGHDTLTSLPPPPSTPISFGSDQHAKTNGS